jgi:hypothetical protein
MKKIVTLLLGLLLFNNCNHNKPEIIHYPDEENTRHTITHLPFKVKVSERWGLIGVDGKVLFRNKFKNKPSYVVNGIFHVQNAKGLYEYYYAKEKPARINNRAYSISYYDGGLFYEDVVLVRDDKDFVFVRKDGSQVLFNPPDGKKITWASGFHDGLAQFSTESGKIGYVDINGKVVIPPTEYDLAGNFSEGLAVVGENWSSLCIKSYKKPVAYVINKSGKKQFNLDVKASKDNYHVWFGTFVNGLMSCGQSICETDASWTEYYINRKGEKVIYSYHDKEKAKSSIVTPPENTYIIPQFNKKGYALCSKRVPEEDDRYLGIINTEGKMIVDTKYQVGKNYESKSYRYRHDSGEEDLDKDYYITEDFACISEDGKYGLIDFNGNVICPLQFDKIYPFYDGKHAFARIGRTCYLINTKGERMDANKYEIIDDEIEFYDR